MSIGSLIRFLGEFRCHLIIWNKFRMKSLILINIIYFWAKAVGCICLNDVHSKYGPYLFTFLSILVGLSLKYKVSTKTDEVTRSKTTQIIAFFIFFPPANLKRPYNLVCSLSKLQMRLWFFKNLPITEETSVYILGQ